MIQQQFSSTFPSKDFILFHFRWCCYQNFPCAQPVGLGSSCHCFGWQSALSWVWVTIVWWGGRQRSSAPEPSRISSQGIRDQPAGSAWKSQQFLQELVVWRMWWPEHLSSDLFTGRKVIISVRLSIVLVRGWNKDMLCISASIQGRAAFLGSQGISVMCCCGSDGWTQNATNTHD